MRLPQIVLLVFLVSVFWILVTPSDSQSDATATPIAEVTDIPISVYTNTPTMTSTVTATYTRTPVSTVTNPETTHEVELTPEAIPSETITPEPLEMTVEVTPEAEITVESTADALPTPTLLESTAEVTDEVLSSSPTPDTGTITPTGTSLAEITAEVTETIIPMATLEPVISVTPTATLGVPMVFIQGAAFYQNHLPDHSDIEIRVFDESLALLSVAYTGVDGVFTIAVPSNSFYWLVADAPLHRAITLAVQPGFDLPDILLAGGDLNDDGCIDMVDVQLITTVLNESVSDTRADINGDDLVDVIDIAILTGNFEATCNEVIEAEITPTPQPEMTLETTAEATIESVSTVIDVTISPSMTVTTNEGEHRLETPTNIPSDTPTISPTPSVEPTTIIPTSTEAMPPTMANNEDTDTTENEN